MLAHLTPLPPQRTGVADANARLLGELGRRVRVTAYVRGSADPVPGVEVRRASRWAMRRLDRHKAIVAQMGNSAAHAWILREAERRRMIVELHDVVLHHLIAHMHFDPSDGRRYEEAMTRDAGTLGRLVAHGALTGDLPRPWEVAADRFPLTGEAVRLADRVIVHSRFAALQVQARFPEVDVRVVPLLTAQIAAAARERPQGEHWPLIGCFGFVTKEKRLDLVMDAMARAKRWLPSAHLLIVGQQGTGVDLRALITDAGLSADDVTLVDYAEPDRFGRLMAGVDIGINLREPTMGETSATAVQLAGLGIPLIVSLGGWYDEMPDDAVARLDHGPNEIERLSELIRSLADDRSALTTMGEAARTWIDTELSPEMICDAHLDATLGMHARHELSRELTAHVGTHLASIASADARRLTRLPNHIAAAGRELGIL